jgi:hypothetical protein
MSVVNTDKIDAIGIEKKSNLVVLTISDHLPWDDNLEHLLLLQEKINCYISFIESGEIQEVYPMSIGKSCVIDLVCKYKVSNEGMDFLNAVRDILLKIGVKIRVGTL